MFVATRASVHNHFNQRRHLVTRQEYRIRRLAGMAEWTSLVA